MSTEDEAADFAELVTALIDETFEAILDSQADQARHQAEILTIAGMSTAAFARDMVTDTDVAAGKAMLLGSESVEAFIAEITGEDEKLAAAAKARGDAAIDAVFPGRPAANKLKGVLAKGEARAIRSMLDRNQWETYVRQVLTHEQHEAFKEAARFGVPRVVVEHGRITARTKLVVTRESGRSAHSERVVSALETGPGAVAHPIGVAGATAGLPGRGRLAGHSVGRKPKLGFKILKPRVTGSGTGGETAVSDSSSSEIEEQEIEIELEMDFRTES